MNIYVDYDSGNDILYISFTNPPEEAFCDMILPDVCLHRSFEVKERVGLTILRAKVLWQQGDLQEIIKEYAPSELQQEIMQIVENLLRKE